MIYYYDIGALLAGETGQCELDVQTVVCQEQRFLETCSLSKHSSFSPNYDVGMFTFPGLSLER